MGKAGPPVFSLPWARRGGGRIEPLVHHHSITTSPALSIDNVSAVLHPPFGFWLASRQRISIRTVWPCIRSLFSTVWFSRHMDVIVPLIPWRAAKDLREPLISYTGNILGGKTLPKALHPIDMCHISHICPLLTWMKLCNECNYFSQSLIHFNYAIPDYVVQNRLNNSSALYQCFRFDKTIFERTMYT